jgi:hypothetical protein
MSLGIYFVVVGVLKLRGCKTISVMNFSFSLERHIYDPKVVKNLNCSVLYKKIRSFIFSCNLHTFYLSLHPRKSILFLFKCVQIVRIILTLFITVWSIIDVMLVFSCQASFCKGMYIYVNYAI